MARSFDIAVQDKAQKTAGFTIVELLLASSVFSLVLLAALGSFLQIGRLFYKGVSLTNTQTIATSVLADIGNSMQTSANVSIATPYISSTYDYFCVGNARYTFTTHEVGGKAISVAADSSHVDYHDGDHGGSFGLLKDTLVGNSSCSPPCASVADCPTPLNKATEMLGDQMSVANIEISHPILSANLYNISIVVAYGSDTAFDLSNPRQPVCNGGAASQAFCSVINLSTSVFAGTHT